MLSPPACCHSPPLPDAAPAEAEEEAQEDADWHVEADRFPRWQLQEEHQPGPWAEEEEAAAKPRHWDVEDQTLVQRLVVNSAVAAWREDEDFGAWLEETLASEKEAFVGKLQLLLSQRLRSHHVALLEAMEGQIQGGEKVVAEPTSRVRAMVARDVRDKKAAEEAPPASVPAAKSKSSVEGEWAPGGKKTGEWASQEDESKKGGGQGGLGGGGGSGSRQYKSSLIAELVYRQAKSHEDAQLPFFTRVVTSPYFEMISCIIILLNISVMAFEVQFTGCFMGRPLVVHDDCEDWLMQDDEMGKFFAYSAVVFSCCFSLEFVLRLLHLKGKSIRSGWMWFDFFVLLFGIMDTVNRVGTSVDLMVNPTAMRTTRVARMFRMVKFFKARESFHVLFLLMKSILASRHALVWSTLLLFFVMTSVGLVMNQLIYSYLVNPKTSEEGFNAVYALFGTYTRMLITMCELTLGNWAPASRVLMEHVSHWWGIFILIYRCVFCFAIVHVTAAVFITETNRVAADDEVAMMRKHRKDKMTEKILTELFKEIDASNDGSVTLDELRLALEDNVVKSLLEILELEVHNIEELFELMDDGTGTVLQADFIQGILRLRGQAKSSTQVAMMRLVQKLGYKIDDLDADLASFAAELLGEQAGESSAISHWGLERSTSSHRGGRVHSPPIKSTRSGRGRHEKHMDSTGPSGRSVGDESMDVSNLACRSAAGVAF